ncbi:MAG: hypothetical protein L6R38_009671 [Xanthoria sp. 2 TBL-2021]|nr:MAG: hypothetical protein L6R38_009671 [Xanthoria sp. 2 TBL-2021]
MSAILSADDLNDFISPGVACIKPVETLPLQKPEEPHNPYEVTTEDKLPAQDHAPAQISLTDCLACSGCVTSAEAVLVSLQSHSEVLSNLDAHPSIPIQPDNVSEELGDGVNEGKVFVASVSPQVRASIAATYGISELKAGWMIDQLLGGPLGLASGGSYGSGFTWIVDTNAMREACLILGADEVATSISSPSVNAPPESSSVPKKPILTSACPGWICYAEKTHPHVLPHLSRLKSPQALTGTLLKTILSQQLHIRPDQIWHLAVMPCFDKKLEASREEFTDIYWRPSSSQELTPPVRDVDCVITARELLMLADTRGISFPSLPQVPISTPPFPDPILDTFLFPQHESHLNPRKRRRRNQEPAAGPSGGYLHHVLQTQLCKSPGGKLNTIRGRNADVVEYTITRPLAYQNLSPHISHTQHLRDPPKKIEGETGEENGEEEETIFRAARYYGFRNIQNLVRKLKPPRPRRLPGAATTIKQAPNNNNKNKSSNTAKTMNATPAGNISVYSYIEVMACPGGCTNGGGQIKVDDVGLGERQGTGEGSMNQKQWLEKVDEAYYSMSSSDTDTDIDIDDAGDGDVDMQDDGESKEEENEGRETVNGINIRNVREVLRHWTQSTGIEMGKLCFTTFREVRSDVGKGANGEKDRVVELAGRIGGGW